MQTVPHLSEYRETGGDLVPEKAPGIEITHHPITDGGEIRIAINYADYAVDGIGSGKVRIETVRTGKMGRL